jgi:hypothetical protein
MGDLQRSAWRDFTSGFTLGLGFWLAGLAVFTLWGALLP